MFCKMFSDSKGQFQIPVLGKKWERNVMVVSISLILVL